MDSLLGIDWREAWLENSRKRADPGSSACWDERSREYREHSGRSSYTATFLEYLAIRPGQSILDMGSGSGTLAVPLARDGHQVIAADFSAGMRQAALERVQDEGLATMRVMELDWEDNWEEAGIASKSVDVAIASRSTIVEDLADAFMKLDRTARQKVAVTMVTEYGPKGYKPLGSAQEGIEQYVPDFVFGLNLLLQMGAYPELRYIDTLRGNGGAMEDRLVRWAYLSWEPVTTE